MANNLNRSCSLIENHLRRRRSKMTMTGLKQIPRNREPPPMRLYVQKSKPRGFTLRDPLVFQGKQIENLIFHYGILKTCSLPSLTKFGPRILDFLERYKISGFAYFIIQQTFYKHFVAGEDLNESLRVIETLGKQRIISILDYSIESSDYDTENVVNTLIDTIKLCKFNKNTEFSCFKVTALTSTNLLKRVNEVIDVKYPKNCMINWDNLNDSSDAFEFAKAILLGGSDGSYSDNLTASEMEELRVVIDRLIRIGDAAVQFNSSVLIDAEQSYFQRAIHFFVQILYKVYNKTRPVFYGTYQLYLKSSYSLLEHDIRLTKKYQIHLGAKIVRGAYMDSERERAKLLNIEDPIHPSVEATHKTYNNALRLLLKEIKKKSKVSILIATHNEKSIILATKLMRDLKIPASSKKVYFAQLYGLCDHITLSLSRNGFNSTKYIPFGPVKSVIPYLIRRMMENKDVIGKTKEERELIMAEIVRRFLKR